MQHFGGGAPVIWSVTVRRGLPLPALLTYAIYFPALPPAPARGWPQTHSGSRPPADTVLSLRLCRVFFHACHWEDLVHSLPVMLRMARLQEWPALRTFLAGEAIPDSFMDKVSMMQRAAALPEPWLGSSQEGKLARLRRHRSQLLRPTRSPATAMGSGCSFTAFSPCNSAILKKGNSSSFFLIIILWNTRKLKQ